jgi:serine/threonine protein kinase
VKPDLYIGPYRVVGELGRGGMGVVYAAEDPQIGRKVAIKMIQFPADAAEQDLVAMRQLFLREARAAGTLSHPNIVTVYHVGEHEGQPFIAMEFMYLGSLGRRMPAISQNPSYQPKVMRGLRQIAAALDYAHAQNIVHRDVKPDNVLIARSGDFKIADFGIAKIFTTAGESTSTSFPVGTPRFIAPEQLLGKAAGPRSDQYSFAVSVFEVLAGRLPFIGDMTALFYQIVHEPAPLLSSLKAGLNPTADPIIARALAKNPDDRFGSCLQFINELMAALESQPAQTITAPKPNIRTSKLKRRFRMTRAWVIPGILLITAGAFKIFEFFHPEIKPAEPPNPLQSLALLDVPSLRLTTDMNAPSGSPEPPGANEHYLLPAPEQEVTGPRHPQLAWEIWTPEGNMELLHIDANGTLRLFGGGQVQAIWTVRDFKLQSIDIGSNLRRNRPISENFDFRGPEFSLPEGASSKWHAAGPGLERWPNSRGKRWFVPLDHEVRKVVIAANQDAYAVTVTKTLYRIDPSGRILWTYRSPCLDPFLKVVVPDYVVLGCQDEHLYGIRGGKQQWKFTAANSIELAPMEYVRPAVFMDRTGTVYFTDSSNTSHAYAIDSSGKLLWKSDLGKFRPYTVDIDRKGRLYLVGFQNGEGGPKAPDYGGAVLCFSEKRS